MVKKVESNKREICWNLINAGLAGGLVLLGSFTTGQISLESFIVASVAALIVIVTKFQTYWTKEESQYSHAFNFVKI